MQTSKLGRTGVDVGRLGIGCGNGIDEASLRYAIERGVTYVFTSTDLRSFAYQRTWKAIHAIFRESNPDRARLTLAAASYFPDPEKVIAAIADQLFTLRLDYVDVFHWGWVTNQVNLGLLLEVTDEFARGEAARQRLDEILNIQKQVKDELRSKGYARFLGISTHDRQLAREAAGDELVDILMVRYNIGHRGIEVDLLPFLDSRSRPGIVAFNAGRTTQNVFPGRRENSHHDDKSSEDASYRQRYQFALANQGIDVVLAGPANRAELLVALDAADAAGL